MSQNYPPGFIPPQQGYAQPTAAPSMAPQQGYAQPAPQQAAPLPFQQAPMPQQAFVPPPTAVPLAPAFAPVGPPQPMQAPIGLPMQYAQGVPGYQAQAPAPAAYQPQFQQGAVVGAPKQSQDQLLGMMQNLGQAKIFTKGVPLTQGTYHLKFEGATMTTKQDGGELLYFAEFEVLASNNPEHPQGAKRNYCIKPNNNSGPGNLLALVAALRGYSKRDMVRIQTEITPNLNAHVAETVSGTYVGRQVVCEVFPTDTRATATKPAGKYNVHQFEPAPVAA